MAAIHIDRLQPGECTFMARVYFKRPAITSLCRFLIPCRPGSFRLEYETRGYRLALTREHRTNFEVIRIFAGRLFETGKPCIELALGYETLAFHERIVCRASCNSGKNQGKQNVFASFHGMFAASAVASICLALRGR